MIPGGDHSSRSLLFRRIRSWSEVTTGTHDDGTAIGNSSSDGDDQLLRQPLLHLTSSLSANDDNDIECDENDQVLSSPILPQGLSLEYEEQSQESLEDGEDQPIYHTIASTDWKLWIVFGILVTSGVGNVIFAKLQSLPMYNYPTFLNIYSNGMYVLMSFAYIIPASIFGVFGNSLPHLIPLRAMKPFFIMGALDALGAAMQFLATIYLPGTLLVLIPQVAIPLSMAAGSLLLREKYTARQYAGACVVFCGILVVLYPILSHQRDAEYYCQAIDNENDCLLCKEEMTEEKCLSHNNDDEDTNHNSTQPQFWREIEFLIGGNSTDAESDDKNDGSYCAWVSREEADVREEDFLVFFWSIVMLLSCVPSVMSTVYKQVALQTASSMHPIVISGWVSLFQLICGLFLVVPSGLVSSPRLYPLDIGSNWRNGMGCLFSSVNSVDTGCHPDDCSRAALWVHVSLANSAVYALSMLFVLKYGSCDLMYLGLTLVVPLGHLAFDIHSSFAELRAYDIAGLMILVAGLVLYRFGHGDNESTFGGEVVATNDDLYPYEQMTDHGNNEFSRSSGIRNGPSNDPDGFNHDREGFLEFLREPFMLVGDI
eukprot:CAMPEP_0116154706 /NCGR_PEP_ID=MMETSP0329-20121206/21924_1 /TAXON_ID=697910 /ORGANISM="Pseudo-nitzschia arenysensis, Strain B593" /LENGTH=596 /DNA_ID=CAMNT_0003651705 /DNA_START=74 /DNA_END=1864 /DNA_ORIENTATION=-